MIQFAALLGGMMGGMGMANMFPPLQRSLSYTLNKAWRNEILKPDDAVEAYYRHLIPFETLWNDLGSTGVNDERLNAIIKLREQVIGIAESIVLFNRGEIDDPTLFKRLNVLGVPFEDHALWRKLIENRPNVQDVIRFAVREVYSPEIARAYGQFEGAEDVAAIAEPDLKAAGIRPEDLAKYWAAHWELPSVQMGYEMLHRGIISIDELKLLMKTLDIMPFWRDKLINISYNPLTRVDVRRMHKLGVITDDDLIRCYKEIGYNDENAKRLADFTRLYNANPESSEETKTDRDRGAWKDLTKSDIVAGYSDGLFAVNEASDALFNLGYSPEESTFLLSRADYETEKDNVNTLVKAYHTAYLGNVMSHNEVNDKLAAMNLTGQRIENLFNLWDIERSVKTVKPTKAEILSFLRQKIIDKDTAINELLGMGYDDRYVSWYLQTVKGATS
jgi:hypothetical protein